ncbi:hypothetical protein KKH43_02875 [Patescibacteria group bacterium]|nr:hypothetical protein [Patescibacteria group bacterium]
MKMSVRFSEKAVRFLEVSNFLILLGSSAYLTAQLLKEVHLVIVVIAVLVVLAGMYIAGMIGITLWTKTTHMFNFTPRNWMIVFQVLMWPSGLRVLFKLE